MGGDGTTRTNSEKPRAREWRGPAGNVANRFFGSLGARVERRSHAERLLAGGAFCTFERLCDFAGGRLLLRHGLQGANMLGGLGNSFALLGHERSPNLRGGPIFRNRMAAWLRWILGSITPPISPGLPA